MLQKIIKLANVGLFRDGTGGNVVSLSKFTAIFGENGRGKSTLAGVMRAWAQGDAARLAARQTIDSDKPPEIRFLLPNGTNCEFSGGAWSGPRPRIVIFDSEFVDQNVYSGFEVRPEQRQGLLGFVLGDAAVEGKKRIGQLTQSISEETRRRRDAEKSLGGYLGPYSVEEFAALAPVPEASDRIQQLRAKAQACRSAERLLARQKPTEIAFPTVDVDAVFDQLAKQLPDIEAEAEQLVRAHVTGCAEPGFEKWLDSGQVYLRDDKCPFCGQPVEGLALVEAYKGFFNEAYVEFRDRIDNLRKDVATSLSEAKIQALQTEVSTNSDRIDAWRDQIDLPSPSLDSAGLGSTLAAAKDKLLDLVAKKRSALLEPLGSQADRDALAAALSVASDAVAVYNSVIVEIVGVIEQHRGEIATGDVDAIETEIERLGAAQRRQLPEVIEIVQQYTEAGTRRARLEEQKEALRNQIDEQMLATLSKYEARTNELLQAFGAGFRIESARPTYVGTGEPRIEYGLRIRNQSIKLGTRKDLAVKPSFANGLSDGDRRTLAFAFFYACLEKQDLTDAIVVLDDPVSSLDANRQAYSAHLIASLVCRTKQLIVLSHNQYFLRELADQVSAQLNGIQPCYLKVKRVQQDYSALVSCDLEDECCSSYYRDYSMIVRYVDGDGSTDRRDVAKALRPVLEGYYRRRYPLHIARHRMLGQIISDIEGADAGSPLAHLKTLCQELRNINEFAAQFHHSDDAAYDRPPVTDAEVKTTAQRVLRLIQADGK